MRTVDALPEHVPGLIARMGDDQRRKFFELHGSDAESAIIENISKSVFTWCGIDKAGVVNLGGIYPIENDVSIGYIWQFITPAVRDNKRAYLEQGKKLKIRCLTLFPSITTVVEEEYKAAIRHAKRYAARTHGPELVLGISVYIFEGVRHV